MHSSSKMSSVYSSKVNKKIKENVENCPDSIKESSNRHEPLILTPSVATFNSLEV